MTNSFYNHDDGYPATGAPGSSAAMRSQLNKIQAGFDLMPLLTGNQNKVWAVNAAGTAVTVLTTTGTGNVVLSNDPTFVLTDTTTNNATTLAHGWLPKLSGVITQVLRGDGTWGSPPSTSILKSDRSSNTILGAADSGFLINYTAGTFTQTVTAAATLGAGWFVYLRNFGTGVITVDPNGGETIDGMTTVTLRQNEAIFLICDGSNFVRLHINNPVGESEVVLHTGNGTGSTNTCIRRFSTTLTNTGSAITYADSATLGASFTINEDGLYSLSYWDIGASAATAYFGFSLNSAQLTLSISSITVANRLAMSYHDNSDTNNSPVGSANRVVKLVAGDVVRPHVTGTSSQLNGNNGTFLSIRKVGLTT